MLGMKERWEGSEFSSSLPSNISSAGSIYSWYTSVATFFAKSSAFVFPLSNFVAQNSKEGGGGGPVLSPKEGV